MHTIKKCRRRITVVLTYQNKRALKLTVYAVIYFFIHHKLQDKINQAWSNFSCALMHCNRHGLYNFNESLKNVKRLTIKGQLKLNFVNYL